jgi:RNA 2',3'-cyclic 3'-phosphodiesterase
VNRLFIAVWPPGPLMDQLRALERPTRPGLRWTSEDQWHVTLRFLGDVDPVGEASVVEGLRQVASRGSPVQVVAGPRSRPLGPGVWVLPVEGLAGLAAAVAGAAGDVGQPVPDRPYRGHITLARARQAKALKGLPAAAIEIPWVVTELTLVRSDLRADGARYQVIGRWPLVS